MAREATLGPIVYVGMAGERRGKGVRDRLRVYTTGKGLVSGLGEAAMDRAVADGAWLRERLAEVDAGHRERAKLWGRAALERADLHVRWATVADRTAALALERSVLDAVGSEELWNGHADPTNTVARTDVSNKCLVPRGCTPLETMPRGFHIGWAMPWTVQGWPHRDGLGCRVRGRTGTTSHRAPPRRNPCGYSATSVPQPQMQAVRAHTSWCAPLSAC